MFDQRRAVGAPKSPKSPKRGGEAKGEAKGETEVQSQQDMVLVGEASSQ